MFVGLAPLTTAFYDLQDKKIALEYMAINLERGADRINGLNRQASIFNLSTWYNGGAQTLPELRNASDSIRGYGNTMLRTMPDALDLLFGSRTAGRYLPYNQDEQEFIASNLLQP